MIFFLIFVFTVANAAPAVVSEARDKLVREKNRQAATELLVRSIHSEKGKPEQQELLKELDKLSTVFLSNEGQRLFELAESIRHAGQPGYTVKYEEALKLEDANWSVLLGHALGLLREQNCRAAEEVLNLARKIHPYKSETRLLLFRAQVCREEPLLTIKIVSEASIDKGLILYKWIVLAQKSYVDGRHEEALRYAREAIKTDEKFPTGYYWAWKALSNDTEAKSGLDEAQRYLSLCKGLSPALRRKYNLEPLLCVDLDAVESYIKKGESRNT